MAMRGVGELSLFVIGLVLLVLAVGLIEPERSLLFTVGGADGVCGMTLLKSALFSLAMAAKEPERGLLIVVDGVGGLNGVLLE